MIRAQFRRGTAAQWTATNPVLLAGEPGWESDTGKFKLGDGSTAWASLAYSSGTQGVQGNQGSQGTQGNQGATGTQGTTGSQGPQGSQGSQPSITYDTAAEIVTGTKSTGVIAPDQLAAKRLLQCAFLAYNSASDANVTGDGTNFTVIFDTEIYDQNNNFDGTSTFTAPLTGKYHFDMQTALSPLAGTNTSAYILLVTTKHTYLIDYQSWTANPFTAMSLQGSIDCNMDAGDTAIVQVIVAGLSKNVGVGGQANPTNTFFSGHLIC